MDSKCSFLLLGSLLFQIFKKFISNIQKASTKVLAFAILKYICCVLSFKGWEYSLKVCACSKTKMGHSSLSTKNIS